MLTAAELLGRVQRGEVFADDTKVQYVHHVIGGHSWRPQITVPAFYLHATQWQPKQWSGQTVGSLVAACELVLAHQACITRWGESNWFWWWRVSRDDHARLTRMADGRPLPIVVGSAMLNARTATAPRSRRTAASTGVMRERYPPSFSCGPNFLA